MTRRFWIGVALTRAGVRAGDGRASLGLRPASIDRRRDRAWLQFALATPVVLWAGWPFFVRGWASVVNRSLNMFTLIALGIGAAYLYSVVATFAPGIFPARIPRPWRHGPGLLRGRRGDHRAGAARPGARTARARADRRRDPRAARPRAEDRAAHRATTAEDEDVPLDQVQSATACACARAKGAGRRRRARGPLRGRRVDGHRRTDAGREEPRRPVIGGTHQRHRQPGHARREGRRRHAARADRRDGRQGAAQPRADPAAGRPRLRLVRAGGHRWSPLLAFVVWALFGPAAGLRLRAGRGGLGADHRLPLRARPGDADVDHGRRSAGARRPAC